MRSMVSGAQVRPVVGRAVFDGRTAEVFVSDVTARYACVRAIGGAMLPDRFQLVVAAKDIDALCVVTGRRGTLYTVLFE